MSPQDGPKVVQHYGRDRPIDRIHDALVAAGHDLTALVPDDLAGVDEFHLGGRLATEAVLGSLGLGGGSQVLDIGCGIGGAARTMARAYGCDVTGVDLTPSFVDTARELSAMVGLADRTSFEVASADSLRFDDDSFDAVTIFHVGMNVADKAAMFAEIERVLRSDGTLALYDVMRIGSDPITHPMPWAADPATSYVERPDDYATAMRAVGLVPSEPIDRIELVRRAISRAQQHPSSVNLSVLMGPDWPTMFANLTAALDAGTLAPIEITASPVS